MFFTRVIWSQKSNLKADLQKIAPGCWLFPDFVSFFPKPLPYTPRKIFYRYAFIILSVYQFIAQRAFIANNSELLSLHHFIIQFIDIIFPRQCISCWETGAYLCKTCKKKLQPHPEICPYCHRFSKDYRTCIECRTNKDNYLEGIIIPFVYDALLKKLIMRLKYFHKKDIGGFLVERIAIALQANESFQREVQSSKLWFLHTDFWILNAKLSISFVPTHRYREHFVKWYNQSKVLAKKLSEITGIPRIQIATKQKHTKTQASLDRNGRLKNLKNAFSLIPNFNLLGNETILIIDDITTTGSTINELAKLIKHYYPAIKVRGAVLWRHIG